MVSFDHVWLGDDIFVRYKRDVYMVDMDFYNQTLYGDKRFENMRMQYIVFDSGVSFKLSDSEMKHFSYVEEAASKSNRNSVCVVMVNFSNNSALANVLSEYQSFCQRYGWQCVVFNNHEEALSWVEGNPYLNHVSVDSIADLV